jgi:hypothetical protein
LAPEQKIRATVKVIDGPVYTAKESGCTSDRSRGDARRVRNWSLTVERLSPVPHQDPERPEQTRAGREDWANDLVA